MITALKRKKSNIKYKVREEPRLREQDFGNFQGSIKQMAKVWEERAHYGHFFYRIPNGESAADVYDRVAGFNETLFRQFQNDDFPSVLVLVSHGIWCRVFLMKWYRWGYEKFEEFRNLGHCEFLIMEREGLENESNNHHHYNNNNNEQKSSTSSSSAKRYALLTPLRTWNDPPSAVLVPPVLKRDKHSKHSISLRYKEIRTRDETALQKQDKKDEKIKEAFMSAKSKDDNNNNNNASTQLFSKPLLKKSDFKDPPKIVENIKKLDEANGNDFDSSSDSDFDNEQAVDDDDDDDDEEEEKESISTNQRKKKNRKYSHGANNFHLTNGSMSSSNAGSRKNSDPNPREIGLLELGSAIQRNRMKMASSSTSTSSLTTTTRRENFSLPGSPLNNQVQLDLIDETDIPSSSLTRSPKESSSNKNKKDNSVDSITIGIKNSRLSDDDGEESDYQLMKKSNSLNSDTSASSTTGSPNKII